MLPAPRRSISLPSPASAAAVWPSKRPAAGAAAILPATAHPPLTLTTDEQAKLAALYGNDIVADAIAHDCFANAAALSRQLAHEAKSEITLDDYRRIDPFQPGSGDRIKHSAKTIPVIDPRNGTGSENLTLEHACTVHADGTVSQRYVTANARGDCIALDASGRFGVPPGWIAEDAMRRTPDGVTHLRTRFIGPMGESGVVARSFDGTTLHLDKAYKSTLPTRLAGVPNFDRSVATVNYMTARACRLLGTTEHNLQQIKVNRLQHRPVLAHLDWLSRNNPDKTIAELIDHTTWAKSYIRETAATVGHRLVPEPAIDLQGGPAWEAAHPGASQRDWAYLQHETERLTFTHLTRQKIDLVDNASGSWRASAAMALARYKTAQCRGMAPGAAAERMREIDTLLQTRLTAIAAEETGLRQRYGMPPGREPTHLNFDVTYRTVAPDT